MSQAATRYQALFLSLRSRKARQPAPTGLDKLATVAGLRFANRRISVKWLARQAELIDARSPALRNTSDAALDEHIERSREVFIRGKQNDDSTREALAVIREVARRVTGEEPYRVQLMGALAMFHSHIIQMLTGEGKTLTASIVAPLLAWRHRTLHVFTVNDYLAKRDAEGRAPIYDRLRLRCGAIQQEQDPAARAAVYALPIVYGTPKQIVADYLRDQIRLGSVASPWAAARSAHPSAPAGQGGPIVPGLRAAMVDEADGVLIDEAVVPLIIAQSRRGDEMAHVYRQAAAFAGRLVEKQHFTIDRLRRKAELTRAGNTRCEEMFPAGDDPIWRAPRRAAELVRQALVARFCYLKGQHYEIIDGRVQIVDEFTGRILPDRSWEHGLHQSVEAKESLEITADRETLARMSFQRFFRMYPVLCGMTGTAADATGEMERTYSRRVIVIPTNRPVARVQLPTRVFRTSRARFAAVVESIDAIRSTGRPVLVGTRSVEASQTVAELLTARNVPHDVLNAVQDKHEATLVAKAGRAGAVTVATNMAGRGTDIKLDLQARKSGGLHVAITEMHSATRIDRQLIGRAGRQGDPGSAQFLLSLEDELVRLHTPRLAAALKESGNDEELTGASLRMAIALFRLAQRRAEHRGRISRAEVLRQDDWIEKHLPGL